MDEELTIREAVTLKVVTDLICERPELRPGTQFKDTRWGSGVVLRVGLTVFYEEVVISHKACRAYSAPLSVFAMIIPSISNYIRSPSSFKQSFIYKQLFIYKVQESVSF